jgi:hypothetical protein
MTGRFRSGLAKAIRIVMATLLTLVVWAIVTSKPVWTAAGTDGDRILAGVLLLVSATWVISVFWIFFSQPRKKRVAVGSHRWITRGYFISQSQNSVLLDNGRPFGLLSLPLDLQILPSLVQ